MLKNYSFRVVVQYPGSGFVYFDWALDAWPCEIKESSRKPLSTTDSLQTNRVRRRWPLPGNTGANFCVDKKQCQGILFEIKRIIFPFSHHQSHQQEVGLI